MSIDQVGGLLSLDNRAVVSFADDFVLEDDVVIDFAHSRELPGPAAEATGAD